MKKTPQELADITPVEPEHIKLDDSEATFYEDHAAELNWLMRQAFRGMESNSDSQAGITMAEFGKYVFRLGRQYESEHGTWPRFFNPADTVH